MKFSTLAMAGALSIAFATTSFAQSLAPKVPDPTDPFPANPIATNGTPLARATYVSPALGASLATGRSVAVDGPLGLLGGVAGTAGSIVGAGVGTAGSIVGAGVGTAGSVVDGTLGTGYAR